MYGNENSGKKSIINSLKTYSDFNNVNIQIGKLDDKNNFDEYDGIIFVIDSTKLEKLEKIEEKIKSAIKENSLILILANKTDIAGSALRDDVINALNLRDFQDNKNIKLYMSSILQNHGYNSGIKWLISKTM